MLPLDLIEVEVEAIHGVEILLVELEARRCSLLIYGTKPFMSISTLFAETYDNLIQSSEEICFGGDLGLVTRERLSRS